MREAVRSTLAQELEGMEIIISDDCSSDNTFRILQEEVDQYDGQHNVILRKTKKNLGVNGHLNELVNLSHGELIVLGSGDDVARADKALAIYKKWMETKALVFGCAPILIDQSGIQIGKFFSKGIPKDYSCNGILKRRNAGIFISGFDRAVFDVFGPLQEGTTEDQVLPFRAALMSNAGIEVITEPLVSYRAHDDSKVMSLTFANNKDPHEIIVNKLEVFIDLYTGWSNDFKLAKKKNISNPPRVEKRIKRRLSFCVILFELARESRLFSRIKAYARYCASGFLPLHYALLLPYVIFPRLTSTTISWIVRNVVYSRRFARGI
ncbi:MAG: glycosyltransferase [Candidatus Thiodiazotropha sp. (ex Monitilora ramsayi)]|nr:glycosyltransferase [Candidatus Thiodiazotropha sp. (ex Monitilora ramsayi)]